jgi:hypothetical protein
VTVNGRFDIEVAERAFARTERAWKPKLAKELENAAYPIDLDRLSGGL